MYLYINNTTTQKKRFFTIWNKIIKTYVCGLTVYGNYHIGHLRLFVIFDIIQRLFVFYKYDMLIINNITDIDDKIISAIKLIKGASIEKFVFHKINELQNLLHTFNLLQQNNIKPRVTNNIKEICNIAKILIKKKTAYQTKKGNIYFNIVKYQNYGKLSNINIQDNILLQLCKNISIDKFNYFDFVLWKKKYKYEPYWSTNLGYGRPGWHTECSALAYKYCGSKT